VPAGTQSDGGKSDKSAAQPAPKAACPPAAEKPAAPSEVQPTAEELRFLELTNQERTRRGMNPLQWDPTLTFVARQHSTEMRDKAYFNHQSPTSGIRTPMDRYLKVVARPAYACVGENLFYCSLVDVQRGHNAFMASPTHRENILFPRFEKMGVGIVKNEKGEFWVTEMFLTLRDPNLVASKKLSSR